MKYYTSQIELAKRLIVEIDKYWASETKENTLIKNLKKLEEYNKDLIYKNNDYTSIIKQRLGAKRLKILTEILKD